MKTAISAHHSLWTRLVWERWEALSLEDKLTWFLVVNHTIAILTLIEILVFRKS